MSDEAVEALQADMAAHMRMRGREVTALDNQTLAAQAIEQLERQRAEAKPVAVAADPAPVFAGEREGAHGVYVIGQSQSNDIRTRASTDEERKSWPKIMRRLELLLTKEESGLLGSASWKQRTLAVIDTMGKANDHRAAGLIASADDFQRRFIFELTQLLEASDAAFGDWMSDPVVNPHIGWRA